MKCAILKFFAALIFKSRALHMISKSSTSVLHHQPHLKHFLIAFFIVAFTMVLTMYRIYHTCFVTQIGSSLPVLFTPPYSPSHASLGKFKIPIFIPVQ
jgi:hypothetical protein